MWEWRRKGEEDGGWKEVVVVVVVVLVLVLVLCTVELPFFCR